MRCLASLFLLCSQSAQQSLEKHNHNALKQIPSEIAALKSPGDTCKMVSNPSWAVVRAAAAEALQDTVDKNTTLGQFMDKLAETLSVNYQEVKLYKASLKELIAQKTEDERSSNDTEDQDQDEEDQDGRSSQDGNEDTTEKDSRGMMALRAMAKAMDLHRYSAYRYLGYIQRRLISVLRTKYFVFDPRT